MHWLASLRNLWPGALRQQVTRTGLGFSATILLVALAAVFSANNLLFLILAAMLAVFAISGFVSKLVLAGLEVDLLLPPHLAARQKTRATVRLKNLKRWMPSFSIELSGAPDSGYTGALYFPVLPGGRTVEEPIHLLFPRRGRHRERTFQLTTRFPFGFAERRDRATLREDIIIYPCLDPRPGLEVLLQAVSGELDALRRGQGHDFYRIRPYEALESSRRVDWKATAHTNTLQVREFTQEEEHSVLVYLDLNVSPADADWFEAAVEAAAFMLYRLDAAGHRVRLRTQEFDVTCPVEGDIHVLLHYLALVSPRPGAAADPPDEQNRIQLVLSNNAQRIAQAGWREEHRGVRLVNSQEIVDSPTPSVVP